MTAAGELSTFSDAKRLDIRKALADLLQLAIELITLRLKAGSVVVEATIEVPPAGNSTSIEAALKTGLGTAASASSLLGITLEADPVITQVTSTPPASNSDDGMGGGLIAIIIVLVLTVTIVPLVLYYSRHKSNSSSDVKVTDKKPRPRAAFDMNPSSA